MAIKFKKAASGIVFIWAIALSDDLPFALQTNQTIKNEVTNRVILNRERFPFALGINQSYLGSVLVSAEYTFGGVVSIGMRGGIISGPLLGIQARLFFLRKNFSPYLEIQETFLWKAEIFKPVSGVLAGVHWQLKRFSFRTSFGIGLVFFTSYFANEKSGNTSAPLFRGQFAAWPLWEVSVGVSL